MALRQDPDTELEILTSHPDVGDGNSVEAPKKKVTNMNMDIERTTSIAMSDGKTRSKFQLICICTALFVRLHPSHPIPSHPYYFPSIQPSPSPSIHPTISITDFAILTTPSSPSSSPPSTQQSSPPPHPPSLTPSTPPQATPGWAAPSFSPTPPPAPSGPSSPTSGAASRLFSPPWPYSLLLPRCVRVRPP